jgi:predicted dehydrogenase
MNRDLKVALFGCGRAAQSLHLPVLKELDGVEVAAMAEEDPLRRDQGKRLVPEAEVFDSYQSLLEQADVDAAVITLPNSLHAPAAISAFARGLHVYLEKPLAPTLAAGNEILAAWRVAGTVGMVGHNYRFGTMQREARRSIAEGSIGRAVAVQSAFSTPARELPLWKQRRATGGGALLDLASHHLDLLPWMLQSRPVSVSCHLRSVRSEDDTAAVRLVMEDGLVAQILASISAVEDDRIEIYGDAGRLVIDRYRSDRLEIHPATLDGVRLHRASNAVRSLTSASYWHRKLRGGPPDESFWEALREFSRAAREGRQTTPDLDNGLRCLYLMEAAMRSAAESRTVMLTAETGIE